MFTSGQDVNRILTALGEQLASATSAHFDLLVCGGSALNALGLVTRTTKDVDVLALVVMKPDGTRSMETANPLPEPVVKAAEIVGRDFSLAADWLNPGPTSILDEGPPQGMLERAKVVEYGPALTVRYTSRLDLIHMKLDAAPSDPGKHYQDLLALKPSREEITMAARWCLTIDPSEGYLGELKGVLTSMGYEDVAKGL